MKISKTLPAEEELIPQMIEFVSELNQGLPEQTAFDITLVCEEWLVNIVSYAYPNCKGDFTIHWENDIENKNITITFEDSGIPFNPLLTDEPDVNVHFQERNVGGLGIMLVRQRMNSMDYIHRNGKNILTVKKVY